MIFSSHIFLLYFLPLFLLAYFLVPPKGRNIVLLLASIVFYAWGNPVYVILLILSTVFNYCVGYDLAETQAGVQCWIDLMEAGVSPSEASLEETTSDAQFLSGRLAMYWGGSWFLGAVKTSDIIGDIDVVELPSIDGKKATVIHGLGNCIYVDTKVPDAAKAWVSFLAGETANLISAQTGAAIPALAGTAQQWVDATPEINLKSFITSSEEYSYPYPASANTAEWQTYEADCLKTAFSLDVPVADACAELAEKMNGVLAAE